MDVHIMVSDPKTYADIFIDAGADVLTFHVEALENMEGVVKLCKHIRERGVKGWCFSSSKNICRNFASLSGIYGCCIGHEC